MPSLWLHPRKHRPEAPVELISVDVLKERAEEGGSSDKSGVNTLLRSSGESVDDPGLLPAHCQALAGNKSKQMYQSIKRSLYSIGQRIYYTCSA